MTKSQTPIFVGIDGGGTKCRAVVFDSDYNELSVAVSGPANVAKYGSLAYDSIYSAVDDALKAIDLDLMSEQHRLFVSAGLAGVNVPSAAITLKNWQHPFARFDFTTDIHSAILGAHNGSNGAVLISGTGSCAAGLNNNVVSQFGGHGFILGDKGSGAWLGRAALSKTLESFDAVTQSSDLTNEIQKHLSVSSPSDIVDLYHQAPPAKFAALAPLVISAAHCGDIVALEIVNDGAQYLSSIAKRALLVGGDKLALVGGVTQAILPWLNKALVSSIKDAEYGPEQGAVIYQRTKLT